MVIMMLVSCVSTGSEWTIPYDIKMVAKEQIEGARTYLTSVDGLKYSKEKFDLVVFKINGVKKVNGMWCWTSPYSGHLVGGLCFVSSGKVVIHVGCNPVTGTEVMLPVIRHEAGHAWRGGCYGDRTHAAIYSKGFYNWNPSADVIKSTKVWSSEEVNIPTIIKIDSNTILIEDGPFDEVSIFETMINNTKVK